MLQLRRGTHGAAWRLFPVVLRELGRPTAIDATDAHALLAKEIGEEVLCGHLDAVTGATVLADVWSRHGEPDALEPFYAACNSVDGASDSDLAVLHREVMAAFRSAAERVPEP